MNITHGYCAGLGSQCCDVVLVRGRINLGKPQGVGVSEWETDGEQMGSSWGGMEMGRSVYEQPGIRGGRILSQQGGFQVSKGKRKGTKEK